ncbi:MAG TPA: NAD(P)-dependent oxidoreductase [Acidimicrobiales bacterium]|nr:NAD(P)-dependent oxidoreductase [Acidimicrobiales bacterium]
MEPLDLGFIGLGNIGGALSANLLADGHRVTVYDVDSTRSAALLQSGASVAKSPAEVGGAAEFTFLSLPSPAVMESVARQWLEEAADGGKILVDLTTNAPATVRAVGERLALQGAQLVEAPVTGGAPGARQRQLVFITGGDSDTVERVQPLLDSLGRATFYMGPLGAGSIGKLVNSLLAFTTMLVTLEGLALGAKSGIDLRTLVDMVRCAGGATPYIDRRVEEIGTRGRPPEFALGLAAKDAGLMLDAGREVGVPMAVASAVHQMLAYAMGQGLAGRDISDLAEVMERAASVTLELRPPESA